MSWRWIYSLVFPPLLFVHKWKKLSSAFFMIQVLVCLKISTPRRQIILLFNKQFLYTNQNTNFWCSYLIYQQRNFINHHFRVDIWKMSKLNMNAFPILCNFRYALDKLVPCKWMFFAHYIFNYSENIKKWT